MARTTSGPICFPRILATHRRRFSRFSTSATSRRVRCQRAGGNAAQSLSVSLRHSPSSTIPSYTFANCFCPDQTGLAARCRVAAPLPSARGLSTTRARGTGPRRRSGIWRGGGGGGCGHDGPTSITCRNGVLASLQQSAGLDQFATGRRPDSKKGSNSPGAIGYGHTASDIGQGEILGLSATRAP